MASEPKRCPKCGGPIPAEAPQGLCPKCLYLQASAPTEAGKGGPPKSAPPARQDLAAAFPQLEILELIGEGGMGFVFKARQPKLDRLVALKILPQSLAADPAFAERFAREGRVLAQLNHPNIVTIHDFGQANGFFYLLMEFVDGVNLRQAMKAGRFTPAQALAVVPRICEALQFAHNEGILHRDIKPENILLDTKGRVKIADFGIAKLVGEPHTDASLTATGAVLGTPHYMAPEQLERSGEVDHRADIYSLGVVFYEMLTGELPLGKFQPPSQKVQLDVRLDEVVLHALEKEPARRYQQVSHVKTAVDTIAGGAAPPSPRMDTASVVSAPAAMAQRPDRFWRWFAVAVLALIAIPAGIAVVGMLLGIAVPGFGRARDRAPQAQPQVAPPQSQTDSSQLVISKEQFAVEQRKPGELYWGFKCFVPPDHLASFLLVRWTNGVPVVDPGFCTYFKVGKAGGIDLHGCLISCHRIPESEFSGLTDAQRRQRLAAWHYPESAVLTNAVRWDVSLGAGFTASDWIAMPPYRGVEVKLPQSVRSGHQRVIRLVEFDGQEGDGNQGRSRVELRIFLDPLKSPPIRMLPDEAEHANYVAGRGLAGTMEEALEAVKTVPPDP
ncbi:MAG: serine/threonine-protein kinase [Limisphaerales bacterium]